MRLDQLAIRALPPFDTILRDKSDVEVRDYYESPFLEFEEWMAQDVEWDKPLIHKALNKYGKNRRIIDACCGSGRIVRDLAGIGYDNLLGIDISERRMTDLAAELSSDEQQNITLKQQDVLIPEDYLKASDIIVFGDLSINVLWHQAALDRVVSLASGEHAEGVIVFILVLAPGSLDFFKRYGATLPCAVPFPLGEQRPVMWQALRFDPWTKTLYESKFTDVQDGPHKGAYYCELVERLWSEDDIRVAAERGGIQVEEVGRTAILGGGAAGAEVVGLVLHS